MSQPGPTPAPTPPVGGAAPTKPEIQNEALNSAGAAFRGIAAACRPLMPAIRTVGQARPLAFASEGAVAGANMIPRSVYVGAWALSGVAIAADITTKVFDAPQEKKLNTGIYHTAFHIPASLVIPAVIIHQVVHGFQHSMKHHAYAAGFSGRTKALVPVAAALLAIVPVVPAVDHVSEMVMEPTLGKWLGIEFEHHHGKDKAGGKWRWQQKGEAIHVFVPLDPPAGKKEITVKFKVSSLSVAVRGESIIDGKLSGKVEVDDCTWCLSPDRTELQVMLTQVAEKTDAWPNLLA